VSAFQGEEEEKEAMTWQSLSAGSWFLDSRSRIGGWLHGESSVLGWAYMSIPGFTSNCSPSGWLLGYYRPLIFTQSPGDQEQYLLLTFLHVVESVVSRVTHLPPHEQLFP